MCVMSCGVSFSPEEFFLEVALEVKLGKTPLRDVQSTRVLKCPIHKAKGTLSQEEKT